MRLKSYFSGTVEAALELARTELGEDALLIHARPSTPETRHLGAYEVVFGVAPPAPAAELPASGNLLRAELTHLRRELDRLTQSLQNPAAGPQAATPAEMTLLKEEIEPEWARLLAAGTPLAELVSADSSLGRPGHSPAITALIGPPGAGKTTALVKLAACYGVAAGRPVHMLTTDVYRIAAADQLRTLAAIVGIRCEVCETPAALENQLEGLRGNALVLVDTPGFSLRELNAAGEWPAWFASRTGLDTHLVLPASMKPADLRRLADAYLSFRPSKLLFTKLDETRHFGALLGEAARLGLPLSFFCDGQQIPDDIQEASLERLAALLGLSTAPARHLGAAA
jgi:flagellar biosynthesis protein FlhF